MIVLLPLDDRPVNLDLPRQLAAVAGETLVTPPEAMLGRFLTPGDTGDLAGWLLETAGHAQAAIVSLDMLAYGGLVASRTPQATEAEALRRLQVLRALKAHHPGLTLYAFSVIMRLTITGADPRTRAAGRDIFRYSILRDQAERLGDAEAIRALADVTTRIPADLLAAYLAARARNHAVNRAAIDLLADGILDFLALVQEDTAPAGLHIPEQQALLAHAHARADAAHWRLYPGTDEAAATLLARYTLSTRGLPFPVRVVQRDPAAAEQPALFEDLPLREAVARHVDAVGGTLADDGLILAVQTFAPPQPDLFEMPALPAPTWSAALSAFPTLPGDNWPPSVGTLSLAVADVAYCNGGDPHLLDALLTEERFGELDAYAGWNTAGNTLGTTLAHAALRACARAQGVTASMEAAHSEALWTRLLDDGLYQAVVRAWAMAQAEESGVSALNLAEHAPRMEALVHAAMHDLWRELLARYPALRAYDRPFQTRLPWGRLFEIRIVAESRNKGYI